MTVGDVALLVTALGLGAVLTSVITAISQRRKVGADTMSVLTAAARELVEPLRKELAEERSTHAAEEGRARAEHARELEEERERVARVRAEMSAAVQEVGVLRAALAHAREEARQLRAERELDHARIRELEARLT